MTKRSLGIADLGRQAYRETLSLQRSLREARLEGSLEHDVVLLVEHDPVYTMGRGTRSTSLISSETMLRARGADVIEIERGGDVTWHGHGQLVAYPILDLTQHQQDLHWYLRTLEQTLINTLAQFGLTGHAIAGKTGVWVGQRKIASLGVHVRRWVTMHGLALNVNPDLEWFSAIVPCGLDGVEMTSLARELGNHVSSESLWIDARTALVRALGETFEMTPVAGELERWTGSVSEGAEACHSASERPTFMRYG